MTPYSIWQTFAMKTFKKHLIWFQWSFPQTKKTFITLKLLCTPIVDFIIFFGDFSCVTAALMNYSVADLHKCCIMFNVIWEKHNMLFNNNTISSLDYCHWKKWPAAESNEFFWSNFFERKRVKFSETSWTLTISWSWRFSINWSTFAWVVWILYDWRKKVTTDA